MDEVKLKAVQSAVMDIYRDVKKLCDENNIRYYAVGGTAIGTVRHAGMIPWDDDIDIAMPRKDYEKFSQLSSKLPSYITFSDFTHNYDSPLVFGKAMNKNTCYTDSANTAIPDAYYGIFVDIMPLDGLPDGLLSYKLHWIRLRRLLLLQNLIVQFENGVASGSLPKRALRRVAGWLSRAHILNKRRLKRAFVRCVSRYDFDSSKYSAYIWQFVSNAGVDVRTRFSVNDFGEGLELPFEDTAMRIPIQYDSHLTTVCPDYMTPPPKEKQVPHHSGIIDFDKSYLEYARQARSSK